MRESLGNVKRALKTLNLELSWFSSVVEKEGGGLVFRTGLDSILEFNVKKIKVGE